jgi:hypothetical protein
MSQSKELLPALKHPGGSKNYVHFAPASKAEEMAPPPSDVGALLKARLCAQPKDSHALLAVQSQVKHNKNRHIILVIYKYPIIL